MLDPLHWLLTLRIDKSSFLIPLDVVVALLGVYLLLRSPRPRPLLRSFGAAALGAAVGLLLAWLVSDVWNVFGLPLTAVTRMWVAIAFAGVFLAIMNLWGTRWWRKGIAVAMIPGVLLVAAAGINVDEGAYRDLNDALGIVPYSALPASDLAAHAGAMDPNLGKDWRPPAGMPKRGRVGTVNIAPTASHFEARETVVYLPPAALVPNPPVLPVVMLFSGQPGTPADVFTSGRAAATYDAFAAKHKGLAPIVVSADQLGSPGQNPMCVDSPLGNSATYLTIDVPTWIRTHLPVAESSRYWAVAGYSQGGTCAIQFGAGHPELFGSIVDVLGELAPTIGSKTVAEGFGGSAAAYHAAKPLTLLAKHAPYRDSFAIFGSGARDVKYTRYATELNAAAQRAGMRTELVISRGSGHDWNTVRYVWARALPQIADRMGLAN
ncbi:alpha/beta hydrolase-fold protein [Humibacter ginsengiterrae]